MDGGGEEEGGRDGEEVGRAGEGGEEVGWEVGGAREEESRCRFRGELVDVLSAWTGGTRVGDLEGIWGWGSLAGMGRGEGGRGERTAW